MGSTSPPTKRIVLNFFEYACTGSHMSPGQWRDPSDKSHTKDRLSYWTDLAKLAERGKISYIFFADSYGGQEVFAGNSNAQLKAGNQTASMDPMVLIPAMAAVTKTLGFGVSASTSYLNPYMLARTFSSLDHLTEGRVAWNIVTSWAKSAALSLGFKDVVPHDERYAMADEYMDLCYKFWEGSWADDAVVWDRERRVAFEPEKVRYLDHQGVSGALSCFRGCDFADGDGRKILQDEGPLSDTSVSAADTGAFPGGNVKVWSGLCF
jgi:alkanesulfonate monooxygenase SsuD/methylene tetrahydromethanopterin reductase-like flavin-dependent oxidoreductase (luciferase family)